MAAFLQGDWSLGEKWALTTGLRYTTETRELTRNSFLPVTRSLSTSTVPLFVIAALGPVLTVGSNTYLMQSGSFNALHDFRVDDVDVDDVDSDAWTPLVSLSYALEDVGFIETGSTYLTLSKGFRSGGLSEAPSASLEDGSRGGHLHRARFEVRCVRQPFACQCGAVRPASTTTASSPPSSVSPQGRYRGGATVNARESERDAASRAREHRPAGGQPGADQLTPAWDDGEHRRVRGRPARSSTPAPRAAARSSPSGPGCTVASAATVAGVGHRGILRHRPLRREACRACPTAPSSIAAQYYLEHQRSAPIVPRVAVQQEERRSTSCFDRLSCLSGDLHDATTRTSARA